MVYGILAFLIPCFLQCQPVSGTGHSGDSVRRIPSSWFTVKQLAAGIWRIDDHGGDNMCLVEGDTTALLIDAGTGVADLAGCVASITKLPVLVVNTHGHPDHCGSDFQFSRVYAHPKDFGLIRKFCSEGFLNDAIKRIENESPEAAPLLLNDRGKFIFPSLVPVADGFIFDLGNKKVEVIEVQGHTEGSICLLDTEDKMLFTGDNNNTVVWLFLDGCLPLESYLHTLEKVQRRSKDATTLLPGHGEPLDTEFVNEQIVCARNILNGTCPGDPYKTFAGDAKICYYKRAGIAYDPENLREK
jgi:hydroxyacylglutathione hydrolase